MNTIADFISKDDEIERLNKQLSMVAKFYDDFYKGKINKYKHRSAMVKRENKRLQKRVDKYKAMPKKTVHKGMIKAKELIRAKIYGDKGITHLEIAEMCFIGLASVSRLSLEVENEKLQANS